MNVLFIAFISAGFALVCHCCASVIGLTKSLSSYLLLSPPLRSVSDRYENELFCALTSAFYGGYTLACHPSGYCFFIKGVRRGGWFIIARRMRRDFFAPLLGGEGGGERRRTDGWRVGFTQRHTDTMAYPPALVDRFLVLSDSFIPRRGKEGKGGQTIGRGVVESLDRPLIHIDMDILANATEEGWGATREEKSRDTNSYPGEVLEKGNWRIRAFIWEGI